MANSLQVDAGSSSYEILIQKGLIKNCSELLKTVGSKRPFIISNPTVSSLYLDSIKEQLGSSVDYYLMPDGEQYKSLEQFQIVLGEMLKRQYGRDSIIIALGGGVVGDLAGFVAASYQRGIPFIQVPTTLLAQVDASVGGKTAVNHPLGKNMVGAFHQPSLVVIDPDTLNTLPEREFRAGLAEVIKYGLIIDHDFYQWLLDNIESIFARNPDPIIFVIQRCCQLKADVVAQDEKELGIRAILNLGHTFAHAIEAETGFNEFLHGEAVAIGMIAAMRLSFSLGLMPESPIATLTDLLKACGLPVHVPDRLETGKLLAHMKKDKKNKSGIIHFVLNVGLGKVEVVGVEDEAVINDAWPFEGM